MKMFANDINERHESLEAWVNLHVGYRNVRKIMPCSTLKVNELLSVREAMWTNHCAAMLCKAGSSRKIKSKRWSNIWLEKVHFVSLLHTSSNQFLLSNQDKECTPGVAYILLLFLLALLCTTSLLCVGGCDVAGTAVRLTE